MYERLNIKGLEERGESYYQDRMDAVVKLLNEKGGCTVLTCCGYLHKLIKGW